MRTFKKTDSCFGSIPTHWNVAKLKYFCKISNGSDPTTPGNIPVYGSGKGVIKYCGEYKEGPAILLGRKGTLDRPKYIEGKFWNIDTAMDAYATNGINTRYLYYITTALDIKKYATATAKPSMTQTDYYNMLIPIPINTEQDLIANYLDARCNTIDESISRHQSIIDKLCEYQSALITHAVLHGIHPDQKYQAVDSEWIDKIPNTWDMKRGKWLFREASERSEDGTEELLTVSQYTGVTPRSQKNVTMFEAESLVGYKICHIGDIAANTMWLWAGAIGVSNYEGVISPSYNVYRQITDAYDSEYLDYLLRAIPLVQHYKALSTGIRPSRLRLYPPQFLDIKFPVPPKTEQTVIVAYLKEKITGVTTAIARQKAAIEKLEEYKKSIIFNTVTGKIDVSGNES